LEIDPTLVGIIMTGQGTIPSAVEAMTVGAFDYILKPFDLQTMRPILERAMETRRLRAENVRLRQYVDRLLFESPRYQLIGSSPAMQKVMQLIEKVAATDATVFDQWRKRHRQGVGCTGLAPQQPTAGPTAGHCQQRCFAGDPR
jgi:DNA-binding NtrC family response regulator